MAFLALFGGKRQTKEEALGLILPFRLSHSIAKLSRTRHTTPEIPTMVSKL